MAAEIYSVFDVAKWFIAKGAADEATICNNIHKKIQKLCYYAQAWSYVLNDQPMIDTEFEAWVHGPVNRELWSRLREYNYQEIDVKDIDIRAKEITDKAVLDVLEQVWETYGEYTGYELERLAKSEPPWSETRGSISCWEPCNKIIDPELMKSYYPTLLVEDNDDNENKCRSIS